MRSTWMRKMTAALAVVAAASAGAVVAGAVGDANVGGPAPRSGVNSPSESVFVPIAPCRVVNTQNPAGKFQVGQIRTYESQGNTSGQGGAAACGIPASASALEMTVTAVAAEGPGYLRVAPAGAPIPNATFLNYGPGQNISNTGTVALLAGTGANFQVKAFQARTHVIVDVNGYYVKGLQASVNGDGTIVRGNGLTSGVRDTTGTYRINFDRNVTGCAFSLTIGNANSGSPSPGTGTATPSTFDDRGVYVETYNAAGNPADRPFHLTVSC